MVEKYLVKLNLNKTICAYIIIIGLEAPKKFSAWSDQLEEVLDQAFTCVIMCVVHSMYV